MIWNWLKTNIHSILNYKLNVSSKNDTPYCSGCMFFSSNLKCRMDLVPVNDKCDHYSINWI